MIGMFSHCQKLHGGSYDAHVSVFTDLACLHADFSCSAFVTMIFPPDGPATTVVFPSRILRIFDSSPPVRHWKKAHLVTTGNVDLIHLIQFFLLCQIFFIENR